MPDIPEPVDTGASGTQQQERVTEVAVVGNHPNPAKNNHAGLMGKIS